MKLALSPIMFLGIWIIFALYLGLSGLCKLYVEEQVDKLDHDREALTKQVINRSVDGLPAFKNEYDYKNYMLISRYTNIFPLVDVIPSFFGLICTSMFFGMIGSIVKILLRLVRNEYTSVSEIKYLSEPILGLFTGLCVLGISYVVPTILVSKAEFIRPITLMFLSLFSGIYTDSFFEKLSSVFPTVNKST